MEVSIYMCLCACTCVFMQRIFTCKRRLKCSCVFWSFPMNTTSWTVCVDGVCVCKSFRRLVPFNTVYSVSRLCSSSCSASLKCVMVSEHFSSLSHGCERSIMSEDQWLDLERPRRVGSTPWRGPELVSWVTIWFSATRGWVFWRLFSRWPGLRRCWRSCRWWARRCRPGSTGLHCRRSGACASSARTPPRSPPDTCGWPSARRSRRCETTGRGRAVTETEGFILHLLYVLGMKRLLLFYTTRQLNAFTCCLWSSETKCSKTLSDKSKNIT